MLSRKVGHSDSRIKGFDRCQLESAGYRTTRIGKKEYMVPQRVRPGLPVESFRSIESDEGSLFVYSGDIVID